jgi:putative ABC transport system permease protein
MLKNYLKVAWRHLLRHKAYSFINIVGLAVGITCCLLIMLFVKSELSYDKFHTKANRLYRVWQKEKYQGQDFTTTFTPLPLAAALKQSLPEVEASTRVYTTSALVAIGNTSFSETIHMVDPGFFDMFTFPLTNGNASRPFANSNSILLTPNMAKKYFGNEEAIGKTLVIKTGKQDLVFTVSGIIEKSPENSSIKFNLIVAADNIQYTINKQALTSWYNIYTETYVLLKPGITQANLTNNLPKIVKMQLGKNYKDGAYVLNLLPVSEIHLNKDVPVGIEPNSDPKYAIVLSAIGALILIVACINFIILAISRSASRAMEVGVRKVLGAARKQLIGQFWGEALLITIISLLLGISLALLLIKPFNQLINRELSFNIDIYFIGFCLLLVIAIGLIAGIYPALILSGLKPVTVLKGKLSVLGSGFLRQGMIVGQFVASIALIICTIAIGRQMDYLNSKDLGYKKDRVVIVPTNMKYEKGIAFAKLYKNELLKNSAVAGASIQLYSFAETPWADLGFTDPQKIYHSFQFNQVDADFINLMNLKLITGRNFLGENSADKYTGVIVNEAFVKEYGFTDPIGHKMPGKYVQRIIGVVKDFSYESLKNKIQPLVLALDIDTVLSQSENVSLANSTQPRITVKLRTSNLNAAVEQLKVTWKKLMPNQEFQSLFLDQTIAAQYEQEQRTNHIVKLASGLSIFIACMGLFGLASLTVARRMKEIGIRKVLGASVGNLAALISAEFIKLVLIAFVIASPLAWYAINEWMKDFAYHTEMQWWMFAGGGAIVGMIALITVSTQSVKVALYNPVKSLRSE